MDSDTEMKIKELAQPIVEQEDMFLVDLEEKSGGGERVLWVYVDSEEGDVNVEACTRISRELGFVLDAHELFGSRYRLNVSSPGLSRPLTDRRQYLKNRGRLAKVKYKTSEGYQKTRGIVKEVTENHIVIEISENESKKIGFDQLVETKIVPKI